MTQKNIKIGYFSLPEKTPKDFPRTFLFLDKEKKIRIGNISGEEMPYVWFARLWARGDITLTKEGREFVKKTRL